MSQENVEIVRHLYESGMFDRDPEELLQLATPDVEYVNPPYAVEPGVRRGLVAVAQAMRRFAEVWEESRHELRELYDCGDAVVAAVGWHIRGRGSERELVNKEAHTWTLREGRIARFEWGQDLEAALEAAGSRAVAGRRLARRLVSLPAEDLNSNPVRIEDEESRSSSRRRDRPRAGSARSHRVRGSASTRRRPPPACRPRRRDARFPRRSSGTPLRPPVVARAPCRSLGSFRYTTCSVPRYVGYRTSFAQPSGPSRSR